MKPPMHHPEPGKRVPPKPTHAEMEKLLQTQAVKLIASSRRERHLARILVVLVHGRFQEGTSKRVAVRFLLRALGIVVRFFQRLRFAVAILLGRQIKIPFPHLQDVHAGQLFARAEKKHFWIGADQAPEDDEDEDG